MPDFEQHGYQGFWMPGRRLDGTHGIVVVIKRRFNVDTTAATCEPSGETPPVAFMAEDYDDADPPLVSVRHPSEIAFEKQYVDVIVRGTAYAPNGKPVPQFDVNIRIPGVVNRSLRIFGDRVCEWYPPVKELTYKDLAKGEQWQWLDPDFSDPLPIEKLPLRYEYAYGGFAPIVMSEDEQEMAEEAQAVEEVKEARRERKKEIEAELKAADEKKAQEAKEAAKPKEATTDDKAKALAEDAFGGQSDGLTGVLDAEMIARLNAEEEADDGMKVTSRYHLGRDMPDRPEGDGQDEDAPQADAEGGDEDEEETEADPNDEFFSKSSGATQALNLDELGETSDELRQLLHESAEEREAKMRDGEGTHRIRREGMGDIKLTGDDWAAQYIKERPPKKKRTREEGEYPEMPYPANLAGKGFAVSHREEAIQGLALPNIEDPDDLLEPDGFVCDLAEFDLAKLRTPAGWAAYPMGWYPRARYVGLYPWDEDALEKAKEEALKEWDEDDPDDRTAVEAIKNMEFPMMQIQAFQEAHPKMWAKEVRGDEEVYLTNLTPDGHLFFRLPGLHPTVTVDMSQGPLPLTVNIDQLLVDLEDPEKPAVEMIWRGWQPLRDFEQLAETPLKTVNIIEVDQVAWMDVKRDEAKAAAGKKKEQLTGFIDAISDEDLEKMDAEAEYKKQFKRQRGGVGVRKDDDTDATVFDQDEDRQLYDDEWDESIRAQKDDFDAQAAAIKAAKAEAKAKEYKKKAREMADEEFGIIRDEEGEILVTDADME